MTQNAPYSVVTAARLYAIKPNRVRALEFALAWALRQTHGKLYCECGKVAGDDEHQPKCKWRRAWEVWEGANTF